MLRYSKRLGVLVSWSPTPLIKGVARRAGGLITLPPNSIAYRLELGHDFKVGESHDAQSKLSHDIGAMGVIGDCIGIEMTVAVDFYDQAQAGTIKIHDVVGDRFLSQNRMRESTQELKPELLLGCGHVGAQVAGLELEVVAVGEVGAARGHCGI